MTKTSVALVGACILCLLCGCDQVSRYKVLSTIFDGVPNPPPPEQVCEEYAQVKIAALHDAEQFGPDKNAAVGQQSEHPAYKDKKRCGECHEKTRESGFVTDSKEKLCFHCHKNFIQGAFVHGPVAVAACLSCHDPHSSRHTALLKVAKGELCATCHREKRLAESMHETAQNHNIQCTDCHNPHYGNSPYFLK